MLVTGGTVLKSTKVMKLGDNGVRKTDTNLTVSFPK